jgi:outer membrane receptor protein involved in Fe transport
MTRTHRLIVVGLFAVATARGAHAQAPTLERLAGATLEDLMSITITTATRTAEALGGAPARVDVVTSEQIQRRGYRSVADVLKDLAAFKLDLGGDSDYPAELTVDGIRGAARVVLLLNGIRVSSPTNDPVPILANYPVHNVRQIEIVYGPASALYGADAFSAVINIITNTVDEAPGFRASASVGQFGLYNETASYGARLGHNATLMMSGQALYDRQPDLSRFYPADFQGLTGQRTGTFNSIFGPMTSSRHVSAAYDLPISVHSLEATFRAGGLQLSVTGRVASCDVDPRRPRRLQHAIRRQRQSAPWPGHPTHRSHHGEIAVRNGFPRALPIRGVFPLRILCHHRWWEDIHLRVLAPAEPFSRSAAQAHRRTERAAPAE